MLLRLLAALCLCASPASAHDWYTGKTDPITKWRCCGDHDCEPVPAEDVKELPNGEFLYIPKNWIIPSNRVQQSPDFNYHICKSFHIVSERVDEYNTVQPSGIYHMKMICFFAPPGTM